MHGLVRRPEVQRHAISTVRRTRYLPSGHSACLVTMSAFWMTLTKDSWKRRSCTPSPRLRRVELALGARIERLNRLQSAARRYPAPMKIKQAVRSVILLIALASMTTQGASQTQAPRHRIGAVCNDGWESKATRSGACSHHGGVSCWKYSDGTCTKP
jgi:hypothetical protein